MDEILKYLKGHGEKLDSEIAIGTGIPLADARVSLSALSLKGEVTTCRVIRFQDGKKIDAPCTAPPVISPSPLRDASPRPS